jgi:hypothetical protein
MLKRFFRNLFAYLMSKGYACLVIVTSFEIISYLAFNIVFTINSNKYEETQFYKWALNFVFIISISLFLGNAVRIFLLYFDVHSNIYFIVRKQSINGFVFLYDNAVLNKSILCS